MATRFTSAQYPALRIGDSGVKFRAGRYETDDEEQIKVIREYSKRYPERGIAEDGGSDAESGEAIAEGGELAEASTHTTVAEAEAQHPDLDTSKPAASQETPEGQEVVLAQTPDEVAGQAVNAAGGGDEEGEDYESFTVPELQELARKRGLAVGGNKADLIERLEEDDES